MWSDCILMPYDTTYNKYYCFLNCHSRFPFLKEKMWGKAITKLENSCTFWLHLFGRENWRWSKPWKKDQNWSLCILNSTNPRIVGFMFDTSHVCTCLVKNKYYEIRSDVIMVWKFSKEFHSWFKPKNSTLHLKSCTGWDNCRPVM